MSNDIENDIDTEAFDDEGGGFDDFNKKGTLGDLWRNNPMVKIGVILAGFAIIVGALILFGGKEDRFPPSAVGTAADVSEAPGSSEVSETMRQSLEEENLQRTEAALRNSGSVVPMPIDPPKGTLPLQVEDTQGEDPLDRWRRMQEERVRQQEMLVQEKPQAVQQTPPVDTKGPAIKALSEGMMQQMQAILSNQGIKKTQTMNITAVNYLDELKNRQNQMLAQQQIAAAAIQQDVEIQNILIPAGTIEYGQLLIEANTDAPGPVLVQMVSGPLRGARILGSFQSTDKYIILRFHSIVMDGVSYQADAVGIDPNTTLPGLITDIDNHYFKRIILPAAAKFVSGLAGAISESGTTSIYISDSTVTQSESDKDSEQEVASGIEEAGDSLSDILDDEADKTEPTLRVASGTPMGILFVAPVFETTQETR